MFDIFSQFGAIIGLAVIIALIMRSLKQPLLLGYILTGIIVGPAILGWLQSSSNIEFFSYNFSKRVAQAGAIELGSLIIKGVIEWMNTKKILLLLW